VKTQMVVIDDFYANVNEVRNHVLSLPFGVVGNYPGLRTGPVTGPQFDFLRDHFERRILNNKITFWPGDYNTSFQYTTEDCHTWVHHDATMWAGVCYLSPDPPENSGTTLYSCRDSKIFYHEEGLDDYNQLVGYTDDLSKWKPEITVENKYNRLILYNGACYHRSTTAGFGTDLESSRLFQVFFFNTVRQ
jgi:hypothetical protein